MASRQFLMGEQWTDGTVPAVAPPERRTNGRGWPAGHGDRAVPKGVLWVLRTGADRADLPDCFPSEAPVAITNGVLRVLPPLMLDRLCFLPADFICRDRRCKTYDEYERILADTDSTGISGPRNSSLKTCN
jgi:hypothetical protein